MRVALTESVTANVVDESLPYVPRYTFAGPYVAIGEYASQEQREAQLSNTFGSVQWLWSEDDEVRFRRSDRKLHSALMYVPEEWCSATEDAVVWTDAPVVHGSLQVDVEERFSLPQAAFFWSDRCARQIVCLRNSEASRGKEQFRLRFARDTDLLFDDGHLVGWMLTDPARYLAMGWETPDASEPDGSTRCLLGECLRLTTSPIIEEVMDGSAAAWRALRELEGLLRGGAEGANRVDILLSVVSRIIDDYS